MNKDNIKAPYSILEDKQLKLFDFLKNFLNMNFVTFKNLCDLNFH